ncbi:hypothetical protein B0H10DRAFT_62797 [Mycena sp. CBHHK59/15]|nr:hypothetical protein B0H10DRAFT_62797 [Mycena sp. CBHHK59/15]
MPPRPRREGDNPVVRDQVPRPHAAHIHGVQHLPRGGRRRCGSQGQGRQRAHGAGGGALELGSRNLTGADPREPGHDGEQIAPLANEKTQAVRDFLLVNPADPYFTAVVEGHLILGSASLGQRREGHADYFESEDGRKLHLTGKVATALFEHADDLQCSGCPNVQRRRSQRQKSMYMYFADE